MTALWNIRQVMQFLGIKSRTTIYELVKKKRLPAPVKTVLRSPRWDADEVMEAVKK